MQHDKPFTEAKKIFLKTFVLLHGNSEARIPPSMASHKELLVEWTMLDGDYNNWTMQDLQLAAELGRTLLERNEELENELKQQQAVIEDQAQEIEFLTKQSTSMKEQSENRAKFYEQLEQTIIELERTNTHLSRENEIDKKRIQSLCENIDFLERKCEEMSRALEAIREERAKRGFHGSRGKVNRGSYFNFGSDSSEEDNMASGYGFGYGYGFLRRRSHSLQDLRDYTPSPDEFDSGNSTSPDLKTSESEYVESLENRVEELTTARKSENDKVRELESQMRIIIQENANLQIQLVQTNSEKDEQIADLRKQLLDSGNYSQISFNTSAINATSTRRNSSIGGPRATRLSHLENELELATSTLGILSPVSPSGSSSSATSSPHSPRPSSSSNHGDAEGTSSSSASSTSTSSRGKSHRSNNVDLVNLTNGNRNNLSFMCKRCSAEMSILSLVNSIEVENDSDVHGGCYPDFPYGVAGLSADDHDMEFSSLEHELARATGASVPFDNRHNNNKRSPTRNMNRSLPLFPRHRTSIFQRDKGGRSDGSDSNNEIQLECDEELEYDENFELFLGHQPNFPRHVERATSSSSGGSDAKQGRRLFIMEESSDAGGCSGSSVHDDEDDDHLDLDEEPCLTKDRKPEISRSKKNSGRNSGNKKSGSSKSSKKSSGSGGNSGSGRGMDTEDSGLPVNHDEVDGQGDSSLGEAFEEDLNVTFTCRYHSKLLELPTRIPSDEEDLDDNDDFEYDDDILGNGIHAAKVPGVSSDAAILYKNRLSVEDSTTAVGATEAGDPPCEEIESQDTKLQNAEPLKKTKCGNQESSSASSGYDLSSSEEVKQSSRKGKESGDEAEGEKVDDLTAMEKLPPEKNREVESQVDSNDKVDPSGAEKEKAENTEDDDTVEKGVEAVEEMDPTECDNASSSVVPEYKQILQNLFSMFNKSKRKYPIPIYPYAKGQSSALMPQSSNNCTTFTDTTATNNDG